MISWYNNCGFGGDTETRVNFAFLSDPTIYKSVVYKKFFIKSSKIVEKKEICSEGIANCFEVAKKEVGRIIAYL